MILEDITKGSRDNDGGLAVTAYWAYWDDVLTWPTLDDTPTTLADNVTLTGNFAMKTGKNFAKLLGTMDVLGIQSNMVGPTDGKSFENIVEWQIPKTTQMLGYLEEIKNRDLVLIVVENNGTKRVLGNTLQPCKLNESAANGGKAVADGNFVTMNFRQIGRVAPVYTGTIPLTPAA